MRSILQPTGLRMKERLSSYLCYMYHRHKNQRAVSCCGEPWYHPLSGKRVRLAPGPIGVWSSLIWVGRSQHHHHQPAHPFSSQRRQGSERPTPSPNLPLPWPFLILSRSHLNKCVGGNMERTLWFSAHQVCSGNSSVMAGEGEIKWYYFSKTLQTRNCRQDDRHKIYDSLQRVSFQARKTTTTSYC